MRVRHQQDGIPWPDLVPLFGGIGLVCDFDLLVYFFHFITIEQLSVFGHNKHIAGSGIVLYIGHVVRIAGAMIPEQAGTGMHRKQSNAGTEPPFLLIFTGYFLYGFIPGGWGKIILLVKGWPVVKHKFFSDRIIL
jgi:hypothetical protein